MKKKLKKFIRVYLLFLLKERKKKMKIKELLEALNEIQVIVVQVIGKRKELKTIYCGVPLLAKDSVSLKPYEKKEIDSVDASHSVIFVTYKEGI